MLFNENEIILCILGWADSDITYPYLIVIHIQNSLNQILVTSSRCYLLLLKCFSC